MYMHVLSDLKRENTNAKAKYLALVDINVVKIHNCENEITGTSFKERKILVAKKNDG